MNQIHTLGAASKKANADTKIYTIRLQDLNINCRNQIKSGAISAFDINTYSVHAHARKRYESYKKHGYSLALKVENKNVLIIFNKKY